MSEFLSGLDVTEIEEGIWKLDSALIYDSDLAGVITVPGGFQTDFASVPRVPIAFMLFGNRAHRESVVHDYLYRIDAVPCVSFDMANKVFLEAMKCRGKSSFVRWAMYLGVCLGGFHGYNKRVVSESL
jgi:hypothetical protein